LLDTGEYVFISDVNILPIEIRTEFVTAPTVISRLRECQKVILETQRAANSLVVECYLLVSSTSRFEMEVGHSKVQELYCVMRSI